MSDITNIVINGTNYDVTTQVKSSLSKLNGHGIDSIVKLTQAEYDAITTPLSTTLYIIVEGN